MAMAKDTELAEEQSKELYELVAQKFDLCCIGAQDPDSIRAFRNDPGTLGDGAWKQLSGELPSDEGAPCWWVVLTGDEAEAPKLLCRSLATLLLELRQHRVATVSKLTEERARRQRTNAAAVMVLEEHAELWADVDGPSPFALHDPTAAACDAAQATGERLAERLSAASLTHPSLAGLTDHDVASVVDRLKHAASLLKGTSWDVIRREKFSCTDEGLFGDISRAAEGRIELQRGAASRLAAQKPCPAASFPDDELPDESADVEWEGTTAPLRRVSKDPRLDPDEFKRGPGRKPHGWAQAVSQASRVHLSSMRVLLEVHYDEMYEKRRPLRGSAAGSSGAAPRAKRPTREYRLNQKVVRMMFSKRHEQMQLPQSVKDVL